MSRVAVFGMGYVGCVTAACLSRDGHQVIGVDIDAGKVRMIEAGQSPIAEPGLGDVLAAQRDQGRLTATDDLESAVGGSDIALIAVGTPSEFDGSVSTAAVSRVVQRIGEALRDRPQPYTVVVRSTLLPGVLETQLAPMLEEACGETLGDRVRLCNNPEFLRETTAIRDYDQPPFIIIGAQEPTAAEAVLELYSGILAESIVTDTRSASLVKYACNAFHALKVGFANEIGALARSFGADGQEVMRIACLDKILNISPAYLRPGFSFGGSCLPKDVRALVRHAQQHAIQLELLSSILPSNQSHLERALAAIRESGHRRIGLIGLSFKAGTDDLRESPQVLLAETLLGRGYDLKIFDPGVRMADLLGSNLHYIDRHLPHLAKLLVDDPVEVCADSDLLVLATGVADELNWQDHFTGDTMDLRRDLVRAASDRGIAVAR